jgi:hypothetical protein
MSRNGRNRHTCYRFRLDTDMRKKSDGYVPTDIIPIMDDTPAQGLLLCPKMEPIKRKKKKKKIASTIAANT